MTDTEDNRAGARAEAASHGKVTLSEILTKTLGQAATEKKGIRELEPLQWVGFWLAVSFLGYIVLASAVIFYVCFWRAPLSSAPAPPVNPGDVQQYKQLVDAYKTSSDVYVQLAKLQVERATQLFQAVVASSILPVFSAILGYIFGSKKSGT